MGALFPHVNFNGKYCESSANSVGAMHFFSRIKSNYALSLTFRLRFYAILTFSGFFQQLRKDGAADVRWSRLTKILASFDQVLPISYHFEAGHLDQKAIKINGFG